MPVLVYPSTHAYNSMMAHSTSTDAPLCSTTVSKMERKIKKPIMEKRRRARINTCLGELKDLLLEAMRREAHGSATKLEKADILEMTVQLIRAHQKHQLGVAAQKNPAVLARFEQGWGNCASQVGRYMTTVDGFSPDLCMRVSSQLDMCLNNIRLTRQTLEVASMPHHPTVGAPVNFASFLPQFGQTPYMPTTSLFNNPTPVRPVKVVRARVAQIATAQSSSKTEDTSSDEYLDETSSSDDEEPAAKKRTLWRPYENS